MFELEQFTSRSPDQMPTTLGRVLFLIFSFFFVAEVEVAIGIDGVQIELRSLLI
jgi:hypothetical protein